MIDSFVDDYRFLSNFYDCTFEVRGRSGKLLFSSAEHAFQAAKTLDLEWQKRIRLARSPREAKKLGRQAPVREDWDDVKVDVMRRVLAAKFAEGSVLAERLLATDNKELVEGNTWHDQIWGSCQCGREACEPYGENWLGRLLMERRAELRT